MRGLEVDIDTKMETTGQELNDRFPDQIKDVLVSEPNYETHKVKKAITAVAEYELNTKYLEKYYDEYGIYKDTSEEKFNKDKQTWDNFRNSDSEIQKLELKITQTQDQEEIRELRSQLNDLEKKKLESLSTDLIQENSPLRRFESFEEYKVWYQETDSKKWSAYTKVTDFLEFQYEYIKSANKPELSPLRRSQFQQDARNAEKALNLFGSLVSGDFSGGNPRNTPEQQKTYNELTFLYQDDTKSVERWGEKVAMYNKWKDLIQTAIDAENDPAKKSTLETARDQIDNLIRDPSKSQSAYDPLWDVYDDIIEPFEQSKDDDIKAEIATIKEQGRESARFGKKNELITFSEQEILRSDFVSRVKENPADFPTIDADTFPMDPFEPLTSSQKSAMYDYVDKLTPEQRRNARTRSKQMGLRTEYINKLGRSQMQIDLSYELEYGETADQRAQKARYDIFPYMRDPDAEEALRSIVYKNKYGEDGGVKIWTLTQNDIDAYLGANDIETAKERRKSLIELEKKRLAKRENFRYQQTPMESRLSLEKLSKAVSDLDVRTGITQERVTNFVKSTFVTPATDEKILRFMTAINQAEYQVDEEKLKSQAFDDEFKKSLGIDGGSDESYGTSSEERVIARDRIIKEGYIAASQRTDITVNDDIAPEQIEIFIKNRFIESEIEQLESQITQTEKGEEVDALRSQITDLEAKKQTYGDNSANFDGIEGSKFQEFKENFVTQNDITMKTVDMYNEWYNGLSELQIRRIENSWHRKQQQDYKNFEQNLMAELSFRLNDMMSRGQSPEFPFERPDDINIRTQLAILMESTEVQVDSLPSLDGGIEVIPVGKYRQFIEDPARFQEEYMSMKESLNDDLRKANFLHDVQSLILMTVNLMNFGHWW